FFLHAEDGIRAFHVTGVQTCALPIWLHREAVALLDAWAEQAHGAPYDALDPERQAALRGRLETRLKTNTYDPATDTIVVDADRRSEERRVGKGWTARAWSGDGGVQRL